MKARVATELPVLTGSGYPPEYAARVLPRRRWALGDAYGLASFGVNLVELPPGSASSMRHWHTREDELVYVLEGELVLRTETGEELLTAGMVVGFRAGDPDAHQFFNGSTSVARFLAIGNRDPADAVIYPDVDLDLPDAAGPFRHKDGRPY